MSARLQDDFGLPRLPRVTVGAILREVSQVFGVPELELLADRRAKRSYVPRQAVMGLARDLTLYSLPQIGRAMRRDHTTILDGIRRHAARLDTDPDYASRVRAVSERLQGEKSDA